MYSRVGKITRTDLAVTEEALRVVVLEWLQTIWTPEKKRRQRYSNSFQIFKAILAK